ncbi:hypothetical protein [Marivita sp.]|uniref:hypothetical protein n=1 Tax=Marivita sp. TaxID=2003365 RepID=UPI0025C1FEDB|nr:hypothetical protein [Marivita sp.]
MKAKYWIGCQVAAKISDWILHSTVEAVLIGERVRYKLAGYWRWIDEDEILGDSGATDGN